MSVITDYAPGTPCWVDFGSPDLDVSIDFYGSLFGWEVPETEASQQFGGYRQAMLGDKPAVGMMPLMQEDQPTVWTTYISVEDAGETAAEVTAAGGAVIAEPSGVGELGRMAIFADPAGAAFGIWEPNQFPGAGVVNEAGALSWNELNTRDVGGAREFYGGVFGWTFEDAVFDGSGTYTRIMLGDRPVGGLLDQEARDVPAEVPPYWQVYFAVEDTDAAVEQASAAGASLMVGPMDVPAGRFAILTDPHGAVFGLIATSQEAQETAL